MHKSVKHLTLSQYFNVFNIVHINDLLLACFDFGQWSLMHKNLWAWGTLPLLISIMLLRLSQTYSTYSAVLTISCKRQECIKRHNKNTYTVPIYLYCRIYTVGYTVGSLIHNMDANDLNSLRTKVLINLTNLLHFTVV